MELLDEIINEIDNNAEISLFFTKLVEDDNFGKLFFLHRNELFQGNDVTPLTYLFWTSVPKRVAADKVDIVSLESGLAKIRGEQAKRTFSSLFENLSSELFDIVAYYLINFVRNDPKLKDLITSNDFSYEKMKQTLQNYDVITDNLRKVEITPDHIEKMFSKRMEGYFSDNFLKNLPNFINSFFYMIPDFFLSLHRVTQSTVHKLLKTTDLNLKEYSKILTYLYSLNILHTQHVIFWCPNCIERLLIKTESELSPSNLKLKCLKCNKSMAVSAIYRLDNLLEKCILSKDGLLNVVIAWLLKQNEIDYQASVYGEKYEYDFLCDTEEGHLLIECKMHRKPLSKRSFREGFQQDIFQVEKHLTESNAFEAFLVYNYDLTNYGTLIDPILQKYDNIDIIDYRELNDFINSLKRNNG